MASQRYRGHAVESAPAPTGERCLAAPGGQGRLPRNLLRIPKRQAHRGAAPGLAAPAISAQTGRPHQVFPVRGRSSDTSAKEPVSRILSCAVIPLDAALPRTFISDLPGGSGTCSNRLSRIGPIRLATGFFGLCESLPIWSCSVWGLPCPTPYGASGALLPHLFTLTPAGDLPSRRTRTSLR